jgi:hypothetical protein
MDMKRYLYALFLAVILGGTAMAQPPDTLWTRTYGGNLIDYGRSVQQTEDGGFIITGVANIVPNPIRSPDDLYLIKADAEGDTIWTRTYTSPVECGGNSVQQTWDGGYIVTGYNDSGSGNRSEVYLLKTNASGDTLWTRTYGGRYPDCGYCVRQTQDGGYIIAGSTSRSGSGYDDAWLIKTDPSGNMQWDRTFGGAQYDEAVSVQQTTDGGYILFGTTYSFGVPQSNNAWLIKTGAGGDSLWTRTYHSYWGFSGNCVQQTADGGYILAASVDYFESGGGILIKTDSFGNQQWTSEGWGGAQSVEQTRDGGYIVAGTAYMALPPIFRACLGKANFLGAYQWGIQFDWGSSSSEVHQTQDQGYIIAGTQNLAKVWLARVAPDTTVPNLALEITPVSPSQIIIPANGGSFRYNVSVCNYAPYPRAGTIWNKVRTSENQYFQVFGPVTRTFPEQSSPTRVLTQTIAGSIPYGLLYYISYLGTYPDSVVDSSYFTMIKLPGADGGPWIGESCVTGDLFDEMPVASHVSLKVYDTAGRLVATLVEGWMSAGEHQTTFDGSKLSSGVYLARLQAGEFTAVQKLVLLK